MDAEKTIAEIGRWIEEYDSFVLLSHVRPDGDAIGSQIALGMALEAAGKSVRLVNEDGLPPNLAFMKGSDRIETPPTVPLNPDVVIALDTATQPRVGERCLAALEGCERWINIDHHKSNSGYGTIAHVDSGSPATGQIVYQLIRKLGLPLPEASRDAIYVATSTDTGSFQYPSTTAETYEMAADLIRQGADIGRLNEQTYNSHPLRRVALMRALLNTLVLECNDRVAHWELTQQTIGELGVQPSDSEGLIDVIRGIDTVIVALFFEELPDGKIRVSMRSKDPRVDVCRIGMQFGGGGHSLAAGVRMPGPLAEARTRLMQVVAGEISTFENEAKS
jgi:phosphoesterase RecJ-like protein